MTLRPRITITREGRYYLCVLAFIVGGAVLREVNLLVVLAALMIGPLLLGWRMVVMTMLRLRVFRQLPARIHAGESLTVSVTVVNQRRRLGSWALLASDRVRAIAPSNRGDDDTCSVDVIFPYVGAGQQCSVNYRLALSRRGRYRFGSIDVSTGFPFGFLRGTISSPSRDEVLVCPRIGRLTRAWHQQVESLKLGEQRSKRRRGMADGDYYGLREWRPGDSRRWIHWRTSAKVGTLTVLQFEEVRHRDLVLVLDLWQPTDPTPEDVAQVELAVSFVATAVVELGQRGGNQLAVAVAGAKIDYWAGTASRVLALEVLGELATVEAAPNAALGAALERIGPQFRHGARVLVISTRAQESLEPNALAGVRGTSRVADESLEWFNVRAPQSRQYFELDLDKV